jgi:uncharacterized protein
MVYKCVLIDEDNKEDAIFYNHQKNDFYKGGKRLRVKVKVSHKPLKRNSLHVRIVLGRGCNLKCKYCLQHDSKTESMGDINIETFYANLKRFVKNKKVGRVDFWGGEPLLYFNNIKYIHKRFSVEMGVKNFYFSTNGVMLDDEITDFIISNKIKISVSFDGDGQWLRGYDLEHDEKVVSCLRRINGAGLVSFTPVVTKFNWNIYSFKEKLTSILGGGKFSIHFCPVIIADDEGHEYRIPEERLLDMSNMLYKNFIGGELQEASFVLTTVSTFLKNLRRQISQPSCLAAQKNYLSFDLEGNILACHNFNKDITTSIFNEKLCLGNILDFRLGKKPKIPTKDWLDRWNNQCFDCLVKHMCRGRCIFQRHEYEEYNCKVNFYYFLAFFGFAVSLITGKSVKKIEPVANPFFQKAHKRKWRFGRG